MELDPKIIEILAAVLLAYGGGESIKHGVRYLRRKQVATSLSDDFDSSVPTNPGLESPMTRTECYLRHSNLTDQMKTMNTTLVDIQKDTKAMLGFQVDLSQLEGKLNTQISEVKREIPEKIEEAMDKHKREYHKEK